MFIERFNEKKIYFPKAKGPQYYVEIKIKIKKEGGKEARAVHISSPRPREGPRLVTHPGAPSPILRGPHQRPMQFTNHLPTPRRSLHRLPSSPRLAHLRRTTAYAAGRLLRFSHARLTLLTASIFSGRRWRSPSPVCDCRRPPPSPPPAESPGPDSALIPAGLVSPPSSPRRIRSLVSSFSALFLSL